MGKKSRKPFSAMTDETFTVEGEVCDTTPRAIQVGLDADPDRLVWFPRSEITGASWDGDGDDGPIEGEHITFNIPLWLARKEGLD